MLLNRWPSNSNNNKENVNIKLKPGAFSNPGDITAQYYNESTNRTSKTLPTHYNERKGSREHAGNISSIDSYSRIASQLTTDNDGATSMFEMNLLESQMENKSTHHDTSLSFKGLIEKVNPQNQNVRSSYNLAQINGLKADSSQKSLSQSQNGTSSKNNRPMGYAQINNRATSQKKGSAANTSVKQSKERTPKTPTSNNRRSISREPENNENIDINVFMVPNQSQGKPKSSTEKERKPFSVINRDENEPTDELEQLRRSNRELTANLKKATAELQNEKNKVVILENELSNQTSSITEERAKYQNELLKISQQIKKLRNIQNIYVNEKKHSEKLEGQLNQKEKSLNELSAFLCECLKSMNGIVEHLLVKGDYHLEKNLSQYESTGIEVSDYLRLIHEIRRFVVPRLETAEGFQFNFEWRNQDYKQVIYTTKELMKNKRLQTMRQNGEKNSSSSPRPSDRKGNSSTTSLLNSKSNNNAKSTAQFAFQNNQQQQMTTSSYSYSISNPTEAGLPTELLTSKTDLGNKPASGYHSKSTDIRSTRANSNAQNDYNPALIRAGIQGNTRDEDSLIYDKNTESEGKNDDLLGENIGTTSSILPRTNTMMSAFNETFENISIDDTKKPYPEHSGSNVPAKNYDYPLMAAPNQNQKLESDSLEAVKNKILKRKSEIEARRTSFQGSFCNPESSITSFKDARELKDPIKEENLLSPRIESTHRSHEVREIDRQVHTEQSKSPERKTITQRNSSVPPNREKVSPSPDAKQISGQKKGGLTRSASNLLLGPQGESQSQQNTSFAEKSPSQPTKATPEKQDNTEEAVGKPMFAIAKFNYDPQKENDLCFNKGDRIQVLKKTKSGWWIGLCRNKIGYFPFNFVQVSE